MIQLALLLDRVAIQRIGAVDTFRQDRCTLVGVKVDGNGLERDCRRMDVFITLIAHATCTRNCIVMGLHLTAEVPRRRFVVGCTRLSSSLLDRSNAAKALWPVSHHGQGRRVLLLRHKLLLRRPMRF